MKVLLAHPGTQHAPTLARELDARGLLAEFHTGFALQDGSWLSKISSALPRIPGMRIMRNRVVSGVGCCRVRTNAWNELYAHWRIRQGDSQEDVIHRRNRIFQECIPQSSLQASDAVIGFDTSSWILAKRARILGKPFWLERTTDYPAHWTGMQLALNQRYPEWQGKPLPRPAELVAAEEVEHEIAHRILVGSRFVANSLIDSGVDPGKIVVNPYGVFWDMFKSPEAMDDTMSKAPRPTRFLFAGNIGARKGVPVLLDAWKQLGWQQGQAELWLVGSIQDHHRRLIPMGKSIRLIGQVAKADMAAIYQLCDVFVLPSLSEGFGLVLLEALAAGLPLITTLNTGGPDLRDHGAGDCVTLVQAGKAEELANAIRTWQNNAPSRKIVFAACERLRNKYSWKAYGDRWAALLQGLPFTSCSPS
jgi:starch synthase